MELHTRYNSHEIPHEEARNEPKVPIKFAKACAREVAHEKLP